nr:hypothetical protein [Elioraea thermophila]
MAIPLTRYLSEQGSYEGLDVDAAAIAWCARTITPVYPSFRFRHLAVAHPLYNPNGASRPTPSRRLGRRAVRMSCSSSPCWPISTCRRSVVTRPRLRVCSRRAGAVSPPPSC